MTITEIMRDAHANAVEKGFWEEPVRTFGDQIALMHSELSEALEEFRDHGASSIDCVYTHVEIDPHNMKKIFVLEKGKKLEGVAVEFADVIIRIADTCEHYGIPLEFAIEKKMDYNRTRPHKHGGKVI
jgi:NTP pyrophosphatase (non-canonical NTP hydrolase)